MTPDPWRDAVAFLMFAIDPDPDALALVLAPYEMSEDVRRLLDVLPMILSAVVVSQDDESKLLLRGKLEEIGRTFPPAPPTA